VVGIDCSDFAVAYARASFGPGRPHLRFQTADAQTWDGWTDNTFDCVVSFETMEHLETRHLPGRRVPSSGGLVGGLSAPCRIAGGRVRA